MTKTEGSEFEQPLNGDKPDWENDPLWFKDAVIYELHIKAFFDSDNNGMGDFEGLIQKLDYLQDLGVNTLWLLPFYPSPLRDDGYDIADYRNIHPDYGCMDDFKRFMKEAHRRGFKVITELVINHTSDQHPWFQAARKAPPGSGKRDFYIWSETNQKFPETRIIFEDTEKSNWTWDDEAHAYYWHRFFSHQPDLNFNNPHVVKAVIKLMRFWLDQGVDGMRLDAIPYLCVREGTNNENLPETHDVIKQMRAIVDEHYPHCVFLAEVNQWPENVRDYFSDGDECHMAYHFPLMPRIYMAIAQEDRHPVVDIMRQTPTIPENCQWAIFLRNHDELTLEMVTDKERDYMYQIYVSDPRARLNVGIRRRLAPLMDNELDKIKLMNSLLLSMPGSPIIYYGDEIGMGDNIFLGDRNGVRTPMQWSPDRNGGFSRADPQRLYLPPIMDPIYGYGAVNVEAQLRDRSSLLNWMKHVLTLRKNHQAFGRGELVFLHPGNRKILAYLRLYEDDIILCVSNLSRAAQAVELDLSAYKGCVPVEMLGHTTFPPIGELPYLLTLPGYNYYWFRLARSEDVPAWHEEHLLPEELPTLVLFDGWHSFFRSQDESWRIAMSEKARTQLEENALPGFVAAQNWHREVSNESLDRVHISDYAEWGSVDNTWLLALARVEHKSGEPFHCFLPLALAWENHDLKRLHDLTPFTVAKVRQQSQVGILGDAFADEAFCQALVQAIGAERTIVCEQGVIRCSPTEAFDECAAEKEMDQLAAQPPHTKDNKTTVALNNRFFLKGYRRLQVGRHPEIEIGCFLNNTVKFRNTPPIAGFIEYRDENGDVMTLAVLQGYVKNQGDGWSYTLDYLERFLEDCLTTEPEPCLATEKHSAYLMLIETLGRRTGELHHALGTVTDTSAFDPEPVSDDDLSDWVRQVQTEAVSTLDLLEHRLNELDETVQTALRPLLEQREALIERMNACISEPANGIKIRYHGNLNLGHVLLTENDFLFTDFEYDTAQLRAGQHRKHSPLRDVADVLRSLNHAAHKAITLASIERPNDIAKLEPMMRDWKTEVKRTFLAAYDEAVSSSDLFARNAAPRGLIDLFLLEKAFYELRDALSDSPEKIVIEISNILASPTRIEAE